MNTGDRIQMVIAYRAFAVILLALLPLAACGGGGAKSETSVTNTTVSKGQQLIDLKAALDAGAITPEEYEKQRRKILKE